MFFRRKWGSHLLIDKGDGTVIDFKTKLVLQKCLMGLNNDSTCSGTAVKDSWINAFSYCKNLSFGNMVWRLPNLNEIIQNALLLIITVFFLMLMLTLTGLQILV